jgi:hypothetical protein
MWQHAPIVGPLDAGVLDPSDVTVEVLGADASVLSFDNRTAAATAAMARAIATTMRMSVILRRHQGLALGAGAADPKYMSAGGANCFGIAPAGAGMAMGGDAIARAGAGMAMGGGGNAYAWSDGIALGTDRGAAYPTAAGAAIEFQPSGASTGCTTRCRSAPATTRLSTATNAVNRHRTPNRNDALTIVFSSASMALCDVRCEYGSGVAA